MDTLKHNPDSRLTLPALAAALLMCGPAVAEELTDEPATAPVVLDTDIDSLELYTLNSRHSARIDRLLGNETESYEDSEGLRLNSDIEDGRLRRLIRNIRDDDGLALVDVADASDRRVYFGISTDGIVGFHGKLGGK